MKVKDFLKNRLYYAKVFFLQHRVFISGVLLFAAGFGAAMLTERAHPPVTEEEYAEALRAGTELYNAGRYEEAFELLVYPAQQGYARARYLLGLMHYYGRGVDRDFKLAYENFSAAADGSDDAGYMAARMVFRGEIKSGKKGAATGRLTETAYRGHPAAQRDMGIYSLMSGDAGQAYYWLSLAAGAGDEKAAAALPEASAKVSDYERPLLDAEIKGFIPRK